jgi:hypothetical protein
MTVIAAVEAYRLTGWESTQKCLVDLYTDFQKVADASKKVSPLLVFLSPSLFNHQDDAVDDDGDGVPDVQQIDGKELMTRKTLLFLKVTLLLFPPSLETGIISLSLRPLILTDSLVPSLDSKVVFLLLWPL